MVTRAEVQAEIERAASMPLGPDRVLVGERAVELADELADGHPDGVGGHDLQVDARIELATAYAHGASGPHEFTLHGWLLAAMDRADPPLTPTQRHHVVWNCKWMVERALQTPQVPLPVLQSMVTDVERRYAAVGGNDHVLAKYRLKVARDLGRGDEVDYWAGLWRTAPRGTLSDCAACDAATDATVLAERWQYDAALQRVAATLRGDEDCLEEPAHTLSRACDWYARAADAALVGATHEPGASGSTAPGSLSDVVASHVEAAVRSHLVGWRIARREHAHDADLVSHHAMFLVRAGCTDRALQLVLPWLPRVDEVALDSARMALAATCGAVLRAAMVQRLPQVPAGAHDAILRVERVAGELARAYDTRNLGSAVSARLTTLVDPTPYRCAPRLAELLLEVQPPAAGGDTPYGPGTTTATAPPPTTAARTAPLPADAARMEPPSDLVALADTAKAAIDRLDFDEAERMVAAWAARRSDQPAPTSAQEHRAWSQLDRRLAGREPPHPDHTAPQLLATAMEHAVASGDEPLQRRLTFEIAVHDLGEAPSEADVAPLVDLAADLEAQGHHDLAGSAFLRLTHLTALPGATGRELGERAARAFRRSGDLAWEGMALQAAAMRILGSDLDAGEPLTQRAHDLAVEGGLPFLLVASGNDLARIAWARGDLDQADARFRETSGHPLTAQAPLPTRVVLLTGWCELLVGRDDWAALLTRARALLSLAVATRGPDDIARAQRLVGLALHESGRSHEGAEVLELAVPHLEAIGDSSAAPGHWALGGALASIGEHEQSAQSFESAAAAFLAAGRRGESGHALLRAASGRTAVGEPDAALALLDTATGHASAVGDLPLFVAVRRERADALVERDGVEAGVAALDAVLDETSRAADVQPADGEHAGHGEQGRGRRLEDQLDPVQLRATLQRQAALMLADAGELDRAAARAETAEQLYATDTDDPGPAAVMRTERARMLLETSRAAEGVSLLRTALPVLLEHRYDAARVRAAQALCQHLDQHGHGDEANTLWEAYGPDAPVPEAS